MALLQPDLPKSHGRKRVDDRLVLSGTIFVNRNGLRRRDAPRDIFRRRRSSIAGNVGATKGSFIRVMEGLATSQSPDRKTIMLDAPDVLP